LYGLIGEIEAVPGKGQELAEILAGLEAMPGCLVYLVAHDGDDPDVIWVTEVWRTAEDHQASLEIPEVQSAIAKGRPMIAGFKSRREVAPVGGIGVTPPN
jgi:quinol monooxygenase YgiN